MSATEQQRSNLAQLAAYLRTLPADYPDFAMNRFTQDGEGWGDDPAHVPDCGTAACAVGHGPNAGVEPFPGETWQRYSNRAFIENSDGWHWCFSGNWCRTDNTAHGAAARIEWFLANGVPDNEREQRIGTAPLCYSAALTPRPIGEGK